MRTGLTCAVIAVAAMCGCLLAASAQTEPAQAQTGPQERVSYFRDIVVVQSETLHVATCIFCSVLVRGNVQGEVVSVWGDIAIEGKVEGEAVAAGGRVVLRGSGAVEGEAVSVGGRVIREGSGTVKGDVSEVPFLYLPGQRSVVFPGTLIFVAGNLLFSMLYLAAGRARVEALADTVRKRTALTFVVGAIAMAALLAAFAWATDLETYDSETMAAVSIVMMLLVLPGGAGVSLVVGRLRRGTGIAAGIFSGALLLSVVSLLPLAGLVFFLLSWVFALGATLVGRFGFARTSAVAAAVVSSE